MKIQRLFCTVLLVLTVLTVGAQQRIPCLRGIPVGGAKTRGMLGYPNQDWDPQRIYRQAVVLISFSDCDFIHEDAVAYYQRVLNEPGYNEGFGPGCVADYFRDQSGGQFNLQFDIYGPIKVSVKAKSGDNYGDDAMKEALAILRTTAEEDFSVYDWDGDGEVDQMVFIAAGFTGNQVSGYIWPNTSYSDMKAPGDFYIGMNSISCELWQDGSSCGIGTICHEFTHCLGLPDIYPTLGGAGFSVVDEWDLMDGGNYTAKGWCPPNYSALERMLMGWSSPTELTEARNVAGMMSVNDGGETFIIRNPEHENEFYLLENRQQNGWDYAAPGKGLLIIHVDYDKEVWSNNTVNTSRNHYRYDLFHADGKNYKDWDPQENGQGLGKYTMEGWLRNRYLSTSPYPYRNDSTGITNDALTNDSDPAATLYYENTDGQRVMSKPITGIQMDDDGIVSFDFMMDPWGMETRMVDGGNKTADGWYDLQGRRLQGRPQRKGLYIHNGQKESIR